MIEKAHIRRLAALTFLALGAAACGGEAIEGTWESDYKVAGKRDTFTLDGDLLGEGTFHGDNGGKCEADIEAKTTAREGKYELKIEFKGVCSQNADAELECSMDKDDKVVDCGAGLEFNRVD